MGSIPLEIIGQIDIPDTVMEHRFAQEALACAKMLGSRTEPGKNVIGTADKRQVELYGWARNVSAHVDNSGIVYLVALNHGATRVSALPKEGGKIVRVDLLRGAVARLDDFCPHHTKDSAERVCAFIGSWPEPHDEEAIAALRTGVDKLAAGEYYGAPRVSIGFRALMPDECFAANENLTDCDVLLLADAISQDRFIQSCGLCDENAVHLDSHWPYDMSGNRCRNHLKGKP